jgi:hypothetical protein
MKEIPLTREYVALVDDDDYAALMKYRWYVHVLPDGRCYAQRTIPRPNQKTVLMHRQILGFPKTAIDHRDHNGINNQRSNIREATRAENNRNGRIRRDNTSGFRGVSYAPRRNKWLSRIRNGERQVTLGYFNTAREAAYVYDAMAKKLHGEFASLNFAPEDHHAIE